MVTEGRSVIGINKKALPTVKQVGPMLTNVAVLVSAKQRY